MGFQAPTVLRCHCLPACLCLHKAGIEFVQSYKLDNSHIVFRVVHRFGQTCRFCHVGVVGMGMVLDLLTHANTVPITGNPQVSATHSHAHTHEWCPSQS